MDWAIWTSIKNLLCKTTLQRTVWPFGKNFSHLYDMWCVIKTKFYVIILLCTMCVLCCTKSSFLLWYFTCVNNTMKLHGVGPQKPVCHRHYVEDLKFNTTYSLLQPTDFTSSHEIEVHTVGHLVTSNVMSQHLIVLKLHSAPECSECRKLH
jgi:hypothetical protein